MEFKHALHAAVAAATAIHSGDVRITQSHLISSLALSIEETEIQRGREKSLIS